MKNGGIDWPVALNAQATVVVVVDPLSALVALPTCFLPFLNDIPVSSTLNIRVNMMLVFYGLQLVIEYFNVYFLKHRDRV